MGLRGPKKGERFGGRVKGTPNKVPALLKEAILQAAREAGDELLLACKEKNVNKDQDGLVFFLKAQAKSENNGPFMGLVGKVLPLTIAGDPNNPLQVVQKIERAIVPIDSWQDTEDSDAPSIRSVN